jgi:serine/threonine protein kinase
MSPEIIELEKGDENHFYAPGPSDIYACGVILYVMITGSYPYGKASQDDAQYKKYVYNNSQFWKDVKKKYKMSPELVQLFNGICELHTEKRFNFDQIEASQWMQMPTIEKSDLNRMIHQIKEIKTRNLTAQEEAGMIDEYIKEKCTALLLNKDNKILE